RGRGGGLPEGGAPAVPRPPDAAEPGAGVPEGPEGRRLRAQGRLQGGHRGRGGAPAGRGGSGMGRALRGRLRVVASALAVAGELLRVPRRAPARAVYHERRRGRAPEL